MTAILFIIFAQLAATAGVLFIVADCRGGRDNLSR